MENNKPTFYTNYVGVGMSNFDFTLVMAHRLGPIENPTAPPYPEEIVCNIIMSPQHAKAFAAVLNDNIRQYEELFGTIKIEPDADKYNEMLKKAGK